MLSPQSAFPCSYSQACYLSSTEGDVMSALLIKHHLEGRSLRHTLTPESERYEHLEASFRALYRLCSWVKRSSPCRITSFSRLST